MQIKKIHILDEPTFGQDARTWAELVDLIRELLAGGTAVISSISKAYEVARETERALEQEVASSKGNIQDH